jgi:hypothetical protein
MWIWLSALSTSAEKRYTNVTIYLFFFYLSMRVYGQRFPRMDIDVIMGEVHRLLGEFSLPESRLQQYEQCSVSVAILWDQLVMPGALRPHPCSVIVREAYAHLCVRNHNTTKMHGRVCFVFAL